MDNFDDIVMAVGSGGTATGIAIANYLTGSKLKYVPATHSQQHVHNGIQWNPDMRTP